MRQSYIDEKLTFLGQENLSCFLELIQSLSSLHFLSICDYSITDIIIPSDFWNGMNTICFRDLPKLKTIQLNSHSLHSTRVFILEVLPSLEELCIGNDCMNEYPVELIERATVGGSVNVSICSIGKRFVLKGCSV